MALRTALVLAAAITAAAPAHADRYEATIAVRPAGVLASVDDAGVAEPVMVGGGGAAGGLSWGVRNWIDLGGEVAVLGLREARYDDATLPVAGNDMPGELARTTRLAQLRATATFRFGVGWVPTVQLALGAGGRVRSAARFRVPSATAPVTPDGQDAELAFDAVAAVRLGLDHRLTRRWTIGVSAGATHCLGLGAPDIQVFDASLAVAYTWYPLW